MNHESLNLEEAQEEYLKAGWRRTTGSRDKATTMKNSSCLKTQLKAAHQIPTIRTSKVKSIKLGW